MTDNLAKKLAERSSQDNKRRLTSSSNLVDFVSNDYLGLARSKELHANINAYSYDNITNLNGSSGSRLLAGNSEVIEQVEAKLAGIFRAQSSLIFNSGYVANLAVISSVPQKGDTIIYDSLSHVCLKEGAWLSKADSYAFKHNDVTDLEHRIKNAQGNIYVIIESVYSMDGDVAPIEEIVALRKKYKFEIIIDEAHSTGVLGQQGSGLVCTLGLEDEFLARVYTFGKAMGVHGACVCGSKVLTDYLINFGRPFIYTTALPVHSIFSIDATFDYLNQHMGLQSEIANRIDYFNSEFTRLLGSIDDIDKPLSNTPIQPIVIPGNTRIKNVAEKLQEKGFDVRPILAPTVRAGSERLRVSLHVHNHYEEIDQLLLSLKNILS